MPTNLVGEPISVSLISGFERFKASESYVTILCRKFCLTVPKNFQGFPSMFQKIWDIWNFYASEGGGITFLRRKHLLHSTENFRWGSVRCFRKIRVSQNFVQKRGISLNSVEKFLSHTADNVRRRTLLCFERILESKTFKQKRGKLQGFVESFFYLTGPKTLRQGTILRFTNFLVVEKVLWMRGGSYHDFPSKSFCLTVPKYFIGEQFCVSKNFLIQNFSCIWAGGHHGSVENFCLTGPKQKVL